MTKVTGIDLDLARKVLQTEAAAIEALVDRVQPGWRDAVVERRFMPKLIVSHALVTADWYRGRVVILYFGYTHCPDICPTTLANLSEVLKRLDTRAYDVAVLFVSVDPDRDTLDVLGNYVRGFAKQIDGLSGPPNGLAALTRRYRVLYRVTKDSRGHPYEVMHSNSVFFFDRSGRARLVTTSTDDLAGITDDVKRLLD